MSDYIKREDAVNVMYTFLKQAHDMDNNNDRLAEVLTIAKNVVHEIPSADVAPVRHGRWMPLVDCSNAGIYCSLCHKKVFGGEYSNTMKLHSAYCPNCGARMDGESDDE